MSRFTNSIICGISHISGLFCLSIFIAPLITFPLSMYCPSIIISFSFETIFSANSLISSVVLYACIGFIGVVSGSLISM